VRVLLTVPCTPPAPALYHLSQLPSRLHVDSLEYVRALNTAPAPATQRPAGVSPARETLRLLWDGQYSKCTHLPVVALCS
jgi:hypothetical protein